MNDAMQKHIKEVMLTRAHHIETMSAAFLKQVGSSEASKYRLVETQAQDGSEMRITWQFELNPMTNPIQTVVNAMAQLDEQISTIGHAAIVEQLAPIFAARPDMRAIRWEQSTPYFNDGNPCVFEVGVFYFDLGKFTQEEIDEECLCDDAAFATSYDLNPNRDAEYRSDEYKAGWTQVQELLQPLTSIPEQLMERIFGNNRQITITREGEVTVEDYEPEY